MVRKHHHLNGNELEQALGDCGGQEEPGVPQSMESQHWIQLSNRTTISF